jgi:competence protein ComEA
MLRRGPDPLDFAAALRRLDGLRADTRPEPIGRVPHAAAPEPQSADVPLVGSGVAAGEAVDGDGRGFRALDPGRRGVAVLAAVALLGASGGVWYYLRAAPSAGSSIDASSTGTRTVPGPGAAVLTVGDPTASVMSGWPTPGPGAASSAGSTPGLAGGPAGSPPTSMIVVDVVGKVAKPGIITLPASSRIYDAMAAAGGASPGIDLTALDLASRLTDREEIFVGIPPPTGNAARAAGGTVLGGLPGGDLVQAGSSGSASGPAGGAAVVNLNAASQAELETLPGVGAVTAQRILAWRAQHGRFTSVSQLQQVSGIGPSKYAALSGRVTV